MSSELKSVSESTALFSKSDLFAYRQREKFNSGVLLILTAVGLAILITTLLVLREKIPGIWPDSIGLIFSGLTQSIEKGELLGIVLVAFAGGLFFFFLPLELIYFGYLKQGEEAHLLFAAFVGTQLISQSINYTVGFRLNRLSRLLIPARKFYRLKGFLNHFGPPAIFIINALPLPSPMLSAILGVFRYNLTRFYLYTMGGQIALYGTLYLIYRFVILEGVKFLE